MVWYKILWSPWRAEYIKKVSNKENKNCFICDAVRNPLSEDSLTIFLTKKVIVLLNKYPYNAGHLMIAPTKHVKNIEEIDEEEWLSIIRALQISKKILDKLYKPEGYNIGVNIGRAAGAGLEDHLHIHIVPRWSGDASFMTVIGETKVLPQSLKDMQREIKRVLTEFSDELSKIS